MSTVTPKMAYCMLAPLYRWGIMVRGESLANFYRDCWRRATSGRFKKAAYISGALVLIAVPMVFVLWKPEDAMMNWLPLIISTAIFFGTVVSGFIAAPYWRHRVLVEDRCARQYWCQVRPGCGSILVSEKVRFMRNSRRPTYEHFRKDR